jgi:hypothetical protein
MQATAFHPRPIVVAALCSLACCWAGAETVQVNVSADLTDYFAGSNWISVVTPLADPVLVHQGDHVDLRVSFLPGQALQLTGIGKGSSRFTGWLLQDNQLSPLNSSIFAIDNFSYSLTGLQGRLSGSFGAGPQTGGSSTLGPSFRGLLAAGDQVSFTGYQVSFDVTSLQNQSSYYSAAWSYFSAPGLDIVQVPVPETNTAALLGAGLLLMSLAALRTRAERPTRRSSRGRCRGR